MQPSQLANPPHTFLLNMLMSHELPTRLDDRIVQKNWDTLQLQLCTTREKGGVRIVTRCAQLNHFQCCPTSIPTELEIIVPILRTRILFVSQGTNNAGRVF